MIAKDLDLHRRMRASLAAIVDLDPEGVGARITETDWEIDRLEALMEAETESGPASATLIEIVPIGAALRAA